MVLEGDGQLRSPTTLKLRFLQPGAGSQSNHRSVLTLPIANQLSKHLAFVPITVPNPTSNNLIQNPHSFPEYSRCDL